MLLVSAPVGDEDVLVEAQDASLSRHQAILGHVTSFQRPMLHTNTHRLLGRLVDKRNSAYLVMVMPILLLSAHYLHVLDTHMANESVVQHDDHERHTNIKSSPPPDALTPDSDVQNINTNSSRVELIGERNVVQLPTSSDNVVQFSLPRGMGMEIVRGPIDEGAESTPQLLRVVVRELRDQYHDADEPPPPYD